MSQTGLGQHADRVPRTCSCAFTLTVAPPGSAAAAHTQLAAKAAAAQLVHAPAAQPQTAMQGGGVSSNVWYEAGRDHVLIMLSGGSRAFALHVMREM